MSFATLLVLGAIGAPLPQASDTLDLHLAHPAIDGARISPSAVVWVQFFERDDTRTLRRTIVDRVERQDRPPEDGGGEGGGATAGSDLVRTQTFLGLDGAPSVVRVNVVDGSTLMPIREEWRAGERATHVDYAGPRVSGAMIAGPPGEAAVVFDETLDRAAFDFNVAPLVLAALRTPAEGLVVRMPHVRISPPAFPVPERVWATFVFEEEETVEGGPLGRVEAWRVRDIDHDMVFWITPQPPHLVRVSFPIDSETLSVMELGALLDDDPS